MPLPRGRRNRAAAHGREVDLRLRPSQIFATIVEGRPNGMPSFRGKLNDDQVWKIAAYVRSLSGQVRKDVAPGRDDDMSGPPPESSTEKKTPAPSGGIPKSAEMPR